jgi:hypothetical protein
MSTSSRFGVRNLVGGSQYAYFLAASTECSTGSNDHFVVVGVVVGVGVPSLVQFDGRPLKNRWR